MSAWKKAKLIEKEFLKNGKGWMDVTTFELKGDNKSSINCGFLKLLSKLFCFETYFIHLAFEQIGLKLKHLTGKYN